MVAGWSATGCHEGSQLKVQVFRYQSYPAPCLPAGHTFLEPLTGHTFQDTPLQVTPSLGPPCRSRPSWDSPSHTGHTFLGPPSQVTPREPCPLTGHTFLAPAGHASWDPPHTGHTFLGTAPTGLTLGTMPQQVTLQGHPLRSHLFLGAPLHRLPHSFWEPCPHRSHLPGTPPEVQTERWNTCRSKSVVSDFCNNLSPRISKVLGL